MRGWIGGLVVVGLLSACGTGGDGPKAEKPPPKTRSIDGVVTVRSLLTYESDSCDTVVLSTAGDIREGAKVIVKSDGATVGVAELSAGVTGPENNDGTRDACLFSFTVSDLPVRKFYEVTVADQDSETFTSKELAKDDWTVEVTVAELPL